MALPPFVRSAIPLVLGLAIGALAAGMFLESMPGAEGSQEARAKKLELELQRAHIRIAALEGADRTEPGFWQRMRAKSDQRTFADGARGIAEDIREGRPVSPDDIFRASQPLLSDLAPLFDRMRLKHEKELIDSMTGELARKYNLTPESQAALRKWFEQKASAEAERWKTLIAQDGTRIQDLMLAARDVRPDDGVDGFMEGVLEGDQLASFKSERTAQRLARIQQEADMQVERLNAIVGLDESQSDQVFGIVARSSPDYEPSMVLEGVGGEIEPTPSGNPRAAILTVLTPEQRAAYDAEKLRRRESAAKDMEAIGLTLPADWELFDEIGFR